MTELNFKDINVLKIDNLYELECSRCGYVEKVNSKVLWKRRQVKKGGCISCRHTGSPPPANPTKNLTEEERILRLMFSHYKINAKVRNITFALSYQDFVDIVSNDCHYCGSEGNIRWDSTKRYSRLFCGIDRKDPRGGYEVRNSLPACTTCNRAKRDKTYEDFIEWIRSVYRNLS